MNINASRRRGSSRRRRRRRWCSRRWTTRASSSVVASTAAGQVRELQLRARLQFRAAHAGRQGADPADRDLLTPRHELHREPRRSRKEQEEALLYRAMQSDIVAQVMRRLAAVQDV